jgi:hypothetical protein
MIDGVCAGVAEYFNIDPTLVRLGAVVLTCLGGSGILASSLGVGRSVDASAIANPAVEPGDSIYVKRPAIGIDEIHIPDVLTFGLGPQDLMKMSTRARQVA